MGKSTISMVMFNSFLYVYRRVTILTLGLDTLDDSSWLDWLWRTAILCPGNGGGESHQKWHPHDVHVHIYTVYIYTCTSRERERVFLMFDSLQLPWRKSAISQELLVELSFIVGITCTHTYNYIHTYMQCSQVARHFWWRVICKNNSIRWFMCFWNRCP